METIPKGIFWIGKWLSGETSIQDFIIVDDDKVEIAGTLPEKGRRSSRRSIEEMKVDERGARVGRGRSWARKANSLIENRIM